MEGAGRAVIIYLKPVEKKQYLALGYVFVFILAVALLTAFVFFGSIIYFILKVASAI